VTDRPVRVRMAPSPTGFFHVGSVRTSLYNWLYAQRQGGTFVLRIEDTDAERNKEEWVDMIYEALRWLGLDWQELYRQSERAELHTAAAQELEAAGMAYWCGCTREDVDARAAERGGPPGYDGYCRDRNLGPGEGRALRFLTPDIGTTVVHDVVRGDPSFENSTIEDFVILRSNGSAMFLLANVVDDGDMAITHVIRGEDHLPNTPKYLLLWDALGFGEHPVFAHLPMIVNEQRKKLSKRRDPVALEQYREEGYLPEVMLNYLALVGWSPPDNRERMTVEEMVQLFRLEDIGKSAGFFDVQKLRAFNGEAIRALPVERFVELATPFLPPEVDVEVFRTLAPLVQERVFVLSEIWPMVDFLFLDEPPEDEASWAKGMKAEAPGVLDAASAAFAGCDWDAETIKATLLAVGEGLELNLKKTQAPVRVAVTGRTVGPPLFESLEVLGRERTLARLAAARAKL
jgi:glutamyl-tRNA synthetase